MDTFRTHFAEFQDAYTLIGGSACDLIFAEQGLSFRATKDLDIIILTSKPSKSFAQTFWKFIQDGGYTYGWRNDPNVHFYRFTEPKNRDYPYQMELFARHPRFKLHQESSTIVPLPLDDDISSLSAILLDDDYYDFLTHGLASIDDISIVDELHLIPLKARAHIDLNDKKANGQHVNSDDLRKHKRDVVRLIPLTPANARVQLNERIQEDMRRFIASLRDENMRVDQLVPSMTLEQLLSTLETIYGL